MTTPSSIIRKACPEHLCRLFDVENLWVRAGKGEFRIELKSRLMNPPKPDHYGRMRVTSQIVYILNEGYPEGDYRRQVFIGHRYLTAEGIVAASGKLDPKLIVVGNCEYRQMGKKSEHCELCVGGDLIPASQRFHGSSYRP